MQASLAAGAQAPAAQVHDVARQVASQQQPVSSTQRAAGLHNATGEFNCFLNVIVQCLWHCTCFRTAVMAWPTAVFQVNVHATSMHVSIIAAL
jgi:ubiquitin C-terminal hydrolase